jgi:hypothetical protein
MTFQQQVSSLVPCTSIEQSINSHFLSESGKVPSLDDLRNRFMNRVRETPGILNEQCPYFEGYCGEHISQYPSITQSNGAIGIAVCGSGTIVAAETRGLCSKSTSLKARGS